MEHKITAPEVGESITEVRIIEWTKQSGEAVQEGETLLEIETDKASVEVTAPHAGVLKIVENADATIPVGAVIGLIDDKGKATVESSKKTSSTEEVSAPSNTSSTTQSTSAPNKSSMRMSKEALLDQIKKLGQITPPKVQVATSSEQEEGPRLIKGESAQKMTRIRKKIAENLVKAQQTAAILTTFNEVDLSAVMELRKKHKESFKEKHGVSLGFMSFFTRACTLALKEQPLLNSSIDGDYIIQRNFINMGIAVGTDKGLVVPVLRDAHKMTFLEIEKSIVDLATKAKNGKLSIKDMSEGTFTISNGGVYGSLLSTPILNPPQSAILGMHTILKRPIVIDEKIEIRPMMNLALSYDHRIVDGKEAVTFLIQIKKRLEEPQELGLDFL